MDDAVTKREFSRGKVTGWRKAGALSLFTSTKRNQLLAHQPTGADRNSTNKHVNNRSTISSDDHGAPDSNTAALNEVPYWSYSATDHPNDQTSNQGGGSSIAGLVN